MEERRISPLTVTALTAQIKGALEKGFSRVYVEAEIVGFKVYPSGHAYFSLKDDSSTISCVMFANALQRCKAAAELRDGAKVIVYANVSVYAPRGQYQLIVLAARLAGKGDLMQRYLELKAKLESEGLFDPAKKRPLPFMPRRVGIVTSEAGAVIHDMCNVLTRRFPALEIRLWPCLVQGAEAPATIIRGIRHFNSDMAWRADVLIVARGGGSFEDLFCFNDEQLVREVASSSIPIISAVGHETDFSLCDFAADRRAGTPSIAAEIAVPVLSDLRDSLSSLQRRMSSALRQRGEYYVQRLDHLGEALGAALGLYRERLERRLERAEDRLGLLSPYGVLARGYSLTTAADGSVVRDAAALSEGDVVTTRLSSGSFTSRVINPVRQ